MRNDLIIDVGLNDGRDTAFYLHRGYRVVAIDANPRWIDEARQRFPQQVSSGQLVLLNVGIGFERGQARLHYSDTDPGSASLIESHVGRRLEITETIQVECVPFVDVLREFGVPFYLKVDIEGLDRACLLSLDIGATPRYVSWEEGADALENLARLREIGYREYKLINQVTFRELSREHSLLNRARYRINGALGRTERPCTTRDGWEFRTGCSGPFGEETDGRWRSYELIVAQWTEFCQRYPRCDHGGGWHDFHART
jgi:FkbM family methyltransferase